MIKTMLTGLILFFSLFIFPVCGQTTLTLSGSDSSMDRFVFAEVLKGAYKKIGIEVFMEAMPSKRSLVSSHEGITDGEMARIEGIESKYYNLLRVPVPIMKSGIYALSLKPRVINGWQDLSEYSLAYRRGIQVIKNKLDQYHLKSEIINLDDELLYFLLFERTEVIIQDKSLAISSMKKIAENKMRVNKIKFIEPALLEIELYHYLNKKHKSIIPKITHQLKILQDSGEINKKIKQYYKSLLE